MVSADLKPALSRRPQAVLLNIGSELLSGRTVNTNASFLGRELTSLGFCVRAQYIVPDQIDLICQGLDQAGSPDLLIVTGGLGPTPDDVTRDALAKYFSVDLRFSPRQFSAMSKIYRKLGRKIPQLSRLEAYYPSNAKPLVNRFGIALGFYVWAQQRLIIVLPGVPSELQKMFIHDVLPLLRKKFPRLVSEKKLEVNLVGISEPVIIEKLGQDFFYEKFEFGIYPSEGEAQICIRSNSYSVLKRLKKKIAERLRMWIYSWDDQSLAQVAGNILKKRSKTLAVSESCTGGSLAHAFTAVSGASQFFRGSMTAYHSDVKKKLGVLPGTLSKHGEVSAETAAELALNACDFFHADYGIGVTGIAGPTGGTRAKPIGLVYVAVAYQGDAQVTKHLFWGNRAQIQRKAVVKAQEQLWRLLSAK